MKDVFFFIRRFAAPYKWNIVWSIVLNLLTALLTVFSYAFIIPILQMLFGINETSYQFMPIGSDSIDKVVVNDFYWFIGEVVVDFGPVKALGVLALMLVAMTLLKVTVSFFSEFFTIGLRNGVVRDMRNTLYDKILSLPVGFFTNERKGDIIARISGDVTEIDMSVVASIYALIKYPISIVIYLTMMLLVSWQLTLFVICLIPVMGGIMGFAGRRLKAQSLKAQQLWSRILTTVDETLGGLRIVKAFNAESLMRRRFHSETEEYFLQMNLINRRYAMAHPVSEFLGTVAVALVLWFGGMLILSNDGGMSAASFIYYIGIFYSIINPAKDLAKTSYAVNKGMASLERIDAILNVENPIRDGGYKEVAGSGSAAPSVSFDNVSFSYIDGHPVLSDICLDIKPGMTVAVVGQSGSGKSTLADLVPRFWDVSAGSVKVNGHDVREYEVKTLRAMMGIVNQEAILFNDSFFNNIAFGVEDATREQVEAAARVANAHEFIMATENGYDTLVGDRGGRLSGGQRQRISIARALLHDPELLILDEATSALDTESERLVQEALERLMKNRSLTAGGDASGSDANGGRTTIVIAHRLSTIRNADLICVMHEGRIVERGTHEQLMSLGGHYRRLVEMQNLSS